jgi:hypothetical protein
MAVAPPLPTAIPRAQAVQYAPLAGQKRRAQSDINTQQREETKRGSVTIYKDLCVQNKTTYSQEELLAIVEAAMSRVRQDTLVQCSESFVNAIYAPDGYQSEIEGSIPPEDRSMNYIS